MLNSDPKKKCTSCYYYYEIRGQKVCRSPHLKESMVDGKKEFSAEYERSGMGQCGPDGEHFELCVTRMLKNFWWGSIYDEDAFRYSITQYRAEKSVDRDTP